MATGSAATRRQTAIKVDRIHRRVVNACHASTFTLYASNDRAEHPCASAARSAAPSISIVNLDVPRVGLRLLSPVQAPRAGLRAQRKFQ
ncbi:hypothetical protein FB451DRAFT_1398749 [Mycena latifolia]|nr:hypothetical protein FB451DRAFT_1398749 [Mycena latifolia]